MTSRSSAPLPAPASAAAIGDTASQWRVVVACTAIMLIEGFDLLIYSNAIPSLLMDATMGLDKAGVGVVGSMVFAGMLLGGLAAGKVVEAWGVARVVVFGLLAFTVATSAIALAGNGWQLGALRLATGLGLGAVLPAALALARSNVRAGHGALAISIVMGGLPLGGMLAAVVSQQVIPAFGWRPLFLAGGVLGLLLMAAIGPALTRAVRLSAASSSTSAQPRGAWKALWKPASRPLLLIGIFATLADLLTWYGITTWLTQLMREFEIPFNGAMQLMFTLNVGAIAGSLLAATLAIRLGNRAVAVLAGLVAGTCLLLLASRLLPGWGLFVAIAVLGMSAISAQNLVNALVADAFPAQHRAAAMGLTLGIGRLGAVMAPALGGHILAAGHGPSWVLAAFAVSAIAGAGLLLGWSRERVQACLASLAPPLRG